MKNNNLSQLDPHQIVKATFQEENDATRVILVGGEKLELNIDSDKIAEAVKEGLKHIDFNEGQKRQNFMQMKQQAQSSKAQTQIIKENVFIPQIEIKEIEKIVYIPQIEYREIERPIIVEKIITIEKPIVIKEIEYKEVLVEKYYPLFMKICTIMQAIGIIGLLISNLIKK